jgi:folate-binding protein YgfZ
MGLTALQANGGELDAKSTSEYRGATTAASFGDPQAEFDALRSGCGVYDLGFRAQISLTGSDRVRWLNGMVTNNIRDLGVDQGVYAFLLNPQGHILGDLYAYNRGDSITVETDQDQVEKILATFDHYIIMDDVEVKNRSEEISALGIGGPKSHEVLALAGFAANEIPVLNARSVTWQGIHCTLIRGDDELFPVYEIWLAPDRVKTAWEALLSAGATPVGSEALEMDRIASGIPTYRVDIRERDLPQETEQTRALNFNKGCYVGQEIVERIRSRGAVHRKFSAFVLDNAAQVKPGTKIVFGEKEVGEITSAASIQVATGNRTVVLGYVRRERGAPGTEVTIGGVKATVVQTPVTNAALQSGARSLELQKHPA